MMKRLTHQEKELLLRDLSARLPYDTQVYSQNENDWFDGQLHPHKRGCLSQRVNSLTRHVDECSYLVLV